MYRNVSQQQCCLITYASRTGSTAGVAEAISRTLSEYGIKTEVLPVHEVKDLSGYSAVIVGSAIQRSKWLPEAMKFIKDNREILSSKPFAAFQVCMTLAMNDSEKYRSGVKKWMDPVRELAKPLNEGFFAGILDINKIPTFSDRLKFRTSLLFGIWVEGDHRDWEAIRSWAVSLKGMLK
jgi:menaquinone-dependent protoporphyrinogen oxidase